MTSSPLFAQAAAVEGATSELLKYGLLGVFCIFLIAALVWTVKGWKASMEARIQDVKEYSQGLKEVNDAGSRVTLESTRSNDAVQGAIEDLERSNTREHKEVTSAFRTVAADMKETSARECQAVKEAVGAVQQEVGSLGKDQAAVLATVGAKGRR